MFLVSAAACGAPPAAGARARASAAPDAATCDVLTENRSLGPMECERRRPLVSQAARQAVPECSLYTDALQRCYARNPAAAALAARQTEAFERQDERAATSLPLRDACALDVERLRVFCP